jgi:hypothetical protein
MVFMIGKWYTYMAIKYSKELLLVALGVVLFSFQAPHPCQFLFGRWEVYKAIDIDEVALFPQNDPEEAEKYLSSQKYKAVLRAADSLATYMIGKQVEFFKDHVIVNGKKYDEPLYMLSREDPDTYLYFIHHVGYKSSLGIPDEIKRIDVICVSLYKDEEQKKKKDLNKVITKDLQIPFPGCSSTFHIKALVIYNDEIILSFFVTRPREDMHNSSWQKYLCLRRVREETKPPLPG